MDPGKIDFYRENLRTLLHFRRSGWPEIKSYYGKLEGTDPWRQLTGWWGGGAPLVDTVKVIQGVVNRFYRELKPSALSEANFADIDALIDSLTYIKKSYIQKYKDEPDASGLSELKSLVDEAREKGEILLQKRSKTPVSPERPPGEKEIYLSHRFRYYTYVDLFCKGLSHAAAVEYAREGRSILTNLYQGVRVVPDSDRTVAKRQVTSTLWGLMEKAVTARGEGFLEGVFLLRDPAAQLFQYFLNYPAKKVSQDPTPYPERTRAVDGGTLYTFESPALPAGAPRVHFNLIDEGELTQSLFLQLVREGEEIDPLFRKVPLPSEEFLQNFTTLTKALGMEVDLSIRGVSAAKEAIDQMTLDEYKRCTADKALLHSLVTVRNQLKTHFSYPLRKGEELIFGPEDFCPDMP